MARIKIDVNGGILEVEGSEEFLKDIYQDFKSKVNIEADTTPTKAIETPKDTKASENKTPKAKTKTVNRKESYSFVTDLNLRGDGKSVPALRDYFSDKKPASALEMTTVFVYYLARLCKLSDITVDHIYTCYKEVGQKVPTALRQNLLDTAHRKGTIDTSSLENVTLTTRGENMVEQDLPAKAKKTKE
jgi:hypothetical protein